MPDSESGETASRTLARHGLSPRKRLGQNFLSDRSFLARILGAANIGIEDSVLEIGAGTGVLTEALAHRARRLIAIELDDALHGVLLKTFQTVHNLELWHGNALDFDPCYHFPGPYKLVGNIPYYVTGPIIRHFLEAECRPSLLVLMVQWEVAQRIAAQPGELSLLGVSVQYYAGVEIIARVPAGAFYPRPKVDSAIVRLSPRSPTPSGMDSHQFFTVVRSGFSARRKQLVNSLANGLHMDRELVRTFLSEASIPETTRAQNLTIAQWYALAEVFARFQAEA